MRRLQPATWFWLLAAAGSVTLVQLDELREPSATPHVVASSGAARRVFPGLADVDPQATTVELVRPNGTTLRFVPQGREEHHLFVGERLVGPVERAAIDGLWASLRMAMTVRAVAPGIEVGAGQSGTIRILGSKGTMVLKLGLVASDSAGIMGVLAHEGDAAWVVDAELAALIEQPEMAWLRRRLLELEPSQLASIAWDDMVLTRGADDIWRVTGGHAAALLSTPAVERRMSALFDAKFEVVEDRKLVAPDSLRPWLVLTDRSGEATKLALGDPCDVADQTRLVDRGPGRLGCVETRHTAAWDFEANGAGLIESRLVPYAYGRVLSIEQLEPEIQKLRRQAGGWVIERDGGEQIVSEPEVFRWFGRVRNILVEPDPAQEGEFQPTVEFIVETDATQRLHVRCEVAQGRPRRCTRDGGAPRRVVTTEPIDLAYNAATFADRRLFSFAPSDVAAFEILPALGRSGVRQSVRQDFGLWRLDHPTHPDAAAAVDLVRLEGVLGVLSSLRARDWLDAEALASDALRTLRVELRPGAGNPGPIGLELFPQCRARVHDGRVVRLHDPSCEVLTGDLLFDDPLRSWVDRAETVVVEPPAAPAVSLRRDAQRRLVGQDAAAQRVLRLVSQWRDWRAVGLAQNPPPGPALARVTLGLMDGGSVVLDVGDAWAGLAEARWHYVFEADKP
ncbi:MAG: hypothetical protein B7733_00860 [Myxococcales bacterium FL481]|nr:MAG: hypothetical protein B7733_00860 [Myxococcales bacterium FL481]